MLNRLIEVRDNQRAERENTESGFTLIELLVVVVIIGILIAIAIPLYLNYQKGAANKSAASDTKNAVAALNQCYSDAGTGAVTQAAGTGNSIDLTCGTAGTQTVNYSDGNTMTITLGTSSTFQVATKAGDPGTLTYTYDAASGQITKA